MARGYRSGGGFIFSEHTLDWGTTTARDILCTIPEAAEAYVRFQEGWRICETRGHDFSIRVAGTPNMWICFRCNEPGWEVPCVEPR